MALGAFTGFVLLASSTDAFGLTTTQVVDGGNPIVKGACATRPSAAILDDALVHHVSKHHAGKHRGEYKGRHRKVSQAAASPERPISGSASDSASTSQSTTPSSSASSTGNSPSASVTPTTSSPTGTTTPRKSASASVDPSISRTTTTDPATTSPTTTSPTTTASSSAGPTQSSPTQSSPTQSSPTQSNSSSSSKTTSPTTSPTVPPSTSPSPSPTKTSPSPSKSPTTTPSPSKSPTKTATPTPTPTKTTKPKKHQPQLCVSVQALNGSSEVHPGHKADYAIWVWSTHGTSRGVAVNVHIGYARDVNSPHFTVCPSSGGSDCSLGTLAAGRADELQATSMVRSAASSGEMIQLTAAATGRNAHSYNASGSIEVVTPGHTPHPTPTPTTTVTLPPVTLPPVTGSGGGANGLFPTISPGTGTSSANGNGGGVTFPSAHRSRSKVTTDAAIVPLDPRLIGGQLAGLAVLLAAIAIAIARLSLRKPRTQDGPDSAKADSAKADSGEK